MLRVFLKSTPVVVGVDSGGGHMYLSLRDVQFDSDNKLSASSQKTLHAIWPSRSD